MEKYKEQNLFVKINKLAAPIILSYLSSYMFVIVDEAILGRTSLDGYASISMIIRLLYYITGTLGAICIAVNILGSQCIAKKDDKSYEKIINTSLTVGLIIGIVVEFIFIFWGKYILNAWFFLDKTTLKNAYIFLIIVGPTVGLTIFLFIFSSYFKSIEKTKVLMYASILANVINLFFDYVFVFGVFGFPCLGVIGVAVGTFIGVVVHCLIYLVFYKKYSSFRICLCFDKKKMAEIAELYFPLLGQGLIEETGFLLIVIAIISRIGIIQIGAYNLSMTITDIITLPVFAYCSISTTLIAKAKISEDYGSIGKILYISIISTIILFIIAAAALLMYPRFFCRLITNSTKLVDFTSEIILMVVILHFTSVFKQTFMSSLNAVNKHKWVLIYLTLVSILSLFCIYYFVEYKMNGLITVLFILILTNLILALGYFLKILFYCRCKIKL